MKTRKQRMRERKARAELAAQGVNVPQNGPVLVLLPPSGSSTRSTTSTPTPTPTGDSRPLVDWWTLSRFALWYVCGRAGVGRLGAVSASVGWELLQASYLDSDERPANVAIDLMADAVGYELGRARRKLKG